MRPGEVRGRVLGLPFSLKAGDRTRDNVGMTDSLDIAQEVDARGMNCPLPILKAKKALAGLQSGQLVRVLATDKSASKDFQAFAAQTGNALVEQHAAADGVIVTVLRRR